MNRLISNEEYIKNLGLENNNSFSVVKQVNIRGKLSRHLNYIHYSAECEMVVPIFYFIDQGKYFPDKRVDILLVMENGMVKVCNPYNYTKESPEWIIINEKYDISFYVRPRKKRTVLLLMYVNKNGKKKKKLLYLEKFLENRFIEFLETQNIMYDIKKHRL